MTAPDGLYSKPAALCMWLMAFLPPAMLLHAAETPPVNYGPEWESIRRQYETLCADFQQQRQDLLADSALPAEQRAQRLQQNYDHFMDQSRQLAARRGEIISIAARRSGVQASLGSDPASGRGMAGDIDLGGTRRQADAFVQELRNLGIADAYDIQLAESKPGYVTIKGPMEVTVNYGGRLGQVGTSAHETQIRIDARSAETYTSVAMSENQPGRKSVETLDHLRKARKALTTAPEFLLKQPEALQTACKGTLKAMDTIGLSDVELDIVLKKSGLKMAPDAFRATLDSVRKGTNIAPELAGLGDHNGRAFYDALDEAARTCQNKAVHAFDIEMKRARGLETVLRQSNDPAVRAQIPEARAQLIDSSMRMRENLHGLMEIDEASLNHRRAQLANSAEIAARSDNSAVAAQTRERLNHFNERAGGVQAQNQRMKLWMNAIEHGVGCNPAGATVFGNARQFTMPGAEAINDVIERGITGYQAFRNSETIAKYMGNAMQAAGGLAIGQSWYLSARAQGDSEAAAAGKGVAAGLLSLSRYGSAVLGAADLHHHWTARAEAYRQDQTMRYALMGLDTEGAAVQDLINTRVNLRRGVYTIVKGTSYGSIFYAHPAAIIAGATLEAGLAVYEAYEDADLWQRYATELEKFNEATDQSNYERAVWIAEQVTANIRARAEHLNRASACYQELMKEQTSMQQFRQRFLPENQKYQDYLRGLARQAEQARMSADLDAAAAQALLTRLRQITSQADQAASHAQDTAENARQNPDAMTATRRVLATLTSEYEALTNLLQADHPNVARCGLLRRTTGGIPDSPLDSIRHYREEMARLQELLKPRYESCGSLVNMSNDLARMINDTAEQRKTYLEKLARYESFLQRRPDAVASLPGIQASRAAMNSVVLPAWSADYTENLKRHYIDLRDLYDAAGSTLALIDGIYPEPLGSLYTEVDPQALAACEPVERQWSLACGAVSEFHRRLALLAAVAGAEMAVARHARPVDQAQPQYPDEALDSFKDQPRDELMAEIARLEALKAELRRRADQAVADLNAAFFADRDALWKAYEAAFKTPRMMACDNCRADTLHSMDYSDSPPSVWCNNCGAIYSFGRWAGAGSSLDEIRQRGTAKKQAILDQLDANLLAIDKAIAHARDVVSGK